MRKTGGTLGLRWLLMASVAAGCSGEVDAVTTANPLLTEQPTSEQPTSAQTSSLDAGGSGTSTEPEAEPSATVTGLEGTSVDEVSSEIEGPQNPSSSEIEQDAGAQTSVNVVDGHLPELSPREDADTCGLVIDNGPPLCDPVAKCGCDSDQTCAFTPDRIRLFTCVKPGSTPDGDRCDYDDTCQAGSVCANGLCTATCRFDSDCGEGSCVAVETAEGTVENLRVCAVGCDPLDAASCGAGAKCANLPGTAAFTCLRQGALGAVNDPCQGSSDCGPGLGCALDGVCRQWCTLETVSIEVGDAGVDAVRLAGEVLGGGCPAYSECLGFDVKNGLGLCGAECPVPEVEGSECALIPSACGCSDGETCQVDLQGKTQCAPPGDHSAMEWCNKNADCEAGTSCISGLCRPVCDPELMPCADGSSCVKATSAANSPSACLGHCDPVRPDLNDEEVTPCGVGGYCSPGISGDDVLGQSYCTRQNDITAKEGAACNYDFDCANGFGCDAGSKTCQRWCRDSAECAAGKTCDLTLSPLRAAGTADPVGLCL